MVPGILDVAHEKRFVKSGNLGYPAPETIEELELEDGTFVRKVIQTVIVEHKTSGKRVESMTLRQFRKRRKADPWPVVPEFTVRLNSEGVGKLFAYLQAQPEFFDLSQSTTYTVLTGTGPLSATQAQQLQVLAAALQRVAKEGRLNAYIAPETLDNLGAAIQQTRYKKALAELRKMLSDESLKELHYRAWFLENRWILGTEYIGVEPSSKLGWSSEGDIILRSVDGYQDIVELKLPSAKVLNFDKSHDNWYPTADLSSAVAQVIKYFHESEDARLLLAEKEDLPFLKPRAKIVIGRSVGWTKAQFDALRRLNAAMQNVQVLTYDHLVQTAEALIEHYELGGPRVGDGG
jgi:hypothetical protein